MNDGILEVWKCPRCGQICGGIEIRKRFFSSFNSCRCSYCGSELTSPLPPRAPRSLKQRLLEWLHVDDEPLCIATGEAGPALLERKMSIQPSDDKSRHGAGDIVLQEVWNAKQTLSQSYCFDFDKMISDTREREKNSGHPVVNLQDRKRA